MLRKILVVLFFLCSINFSNAQIIDVLTGIVEPKGLALHGNDLYFTNGHDKLSKIDITDPNPIVTDVLTGLSLPLGLELIGDDLYIAEFQGHKISKIDVTETIPTVTTVVGVTAPNNFMLNGNDLYITTSSYPGAGKVLKLDITDPNPVVTLVVGGLFRPEDMVLYGNELYISQAQYHGSIVKIDITDPNPPVIHVVGEYELLIHPYGLALYGDKLFIAENKNYGDIKRIDITQSDPEVVDVIVGVYYAWTLLLVEDEMYVTEFGGNRIFKVDLSTLSTIDFSKPEELKVYPNPASEFVQISGLDTSEDYKIINILGAEIKTGKISSAEKIDIQNLTRGVYFLEIASTNTIKFIKE